MNKDVKQFTGRPDESIALSTFPSSINQSFVYRMQHQYGSFFLLWLSMVANIMKSRNASINVKRKVHNEYVLPVMVYGSETWVLKKAHMERCHPSLARLSMARGSLARASLARPSMTRSQFGAFLFGAMPVWRVSL